MYWNVFAIEYIPIRTGRTTHECFDITLSPPSHLTYIKIAGIVRTQLHELKHPHIRELLTIIIRLGKNFVRIILTSAKRIFVQS